MTKVLQLIISLIPRQIKSVSVSINMHLTFTKQHSKDYSK